MQTIINNQSRLVVIGHTYVEGNTHSLHLIPGVNIVEDEVWEKCAKQISVKDLLADKLITVANKTPSTAAALKNLKTEKAAEIVAQTNDAALLDQWADTEKRGTVQTAISDQKKKIADAGKKSS